MKNEYFEAQIFWIDEDGKHSKTIRRFNDAKSAQDFFNNTNFPQFYLPEECVEDMVYGEFVIVTEDGSGYMKREII